METQIAALRDHIIVCGYGRIGSIVAGLIATHADRTYRTRFPVGKNNCMVASAYCCCRDDRHGCDGARHVRRQCGGQSPRPRALAPMGLHARRGDLAPDRTPIPPDPLAPRGRHHRADLPGPGLGRRPLAERRGGRRSTRARSRHDGPRVHRTTRSVFTSRATGGTPDMTNLGMPVVWIRRNDDGIRFGR